MDERNTLGCSVRHLSWEGIGLILMKQLLGSAADFSSDIGCSITVSLTSKPPRVAANKLYQTLGFTFAAQADGENGTNYYKIEIDLKKTDA